LTIFDGWLATNRHTHNPGIASSLRLVGQTETEPADYFRVARYSLTTRGNAVTYCKLGQRKQESLLNPVHLPGVTVMNRRNFLSALGFGSGGFLSLPAITKTARSGRTVWQPDGSGWRARIGVLTPHFDPVPESEFWTMAPEGVSIHVARVRLVDGRTFADPPHADDATELLGTLPVHAIVFAFTTSSYLLGTEGERALKARLEKRSKGIPVLLPGPAAVAAFRALGVQRIALIHPPWFADDVNQLGIGYFRGQGFNVAYASQMHPLRKFTEVSPEELYEWARKQVPAGAEAVFFGGNGLRAIGVISALEKDLGRPVLTANQVALWYALRQAGVPATVNGYGSVFGKLNPEAKSSRN